MSAIPRQPDQAGLAGLRMDAEAFFALGETRERLELIDGVTTMSPSPLPLHQVIVQEVAFQIMTFIRAGAPSGSSPARLFGDTDLRLDRHLVYRPDLSLYGPGRLATVPAVLDAPPDLIIEVLSDSTRGIDLITKRADYERFAVREYWAVDPDTLSARVYRMDDSGRYVENLSDAGPLVSSAVPGLVVNLAAVMRG